MDEYAPSPTNAKAPSVYKMFNIFIHHLWAMKPRTIRLNPLSSRVVQPVEGSKLSPGFRACFFIQNATDSMGGKVYANCRMQNAATTDVSPEKFGIPAARTNAMPQYTGIRNPHAIFPVVLVRGGARNNSIKTLL
jgi:hypothetical protein